MALITIVTCAYTMLNSNYSYHSKIVKYILPILPPVFKNIMIISNFKAKIYENFLY